MNQAEFIRARRPEGERLARGFGVSKFRETQRTDEAKQRVAEVYARFCEQHEAAKRQRVERSSLRAGNFTDRG